MSKYSILAFGFVLAPESLGSFKSLQKPEATSAHRPWTRMLLCIFPPTWLISGIYLCAVMALLIVCLLVCLSFFRNEQFACIYLFIFFAPLSYPSRERDHRWYMMITAKCSGLNFLLLRQNTRRLPVATDERFNRWICVFQVGRCSNETGRNVAVKVEELALLVSFLEQLELLVQVQEKAAGSQS